VRGNAQGLTAVTWVVGVGRGRGCSDGATVDRGGGGGLKLGGGIPVIGGSGSSRGVPGELREVDVVLLLHLAGVWGRRSSGTAMRPSCGGGGAAVCSWAGVSGGGIGKWPAR
jgi:hypothetical protein